MDPSELTVQLIAFRVLALLLLSVVHGATLAGAAVLLGDRGPKYDGRLSVSPARHVDLVGGAGLILFGLGWAKPVDVDPAALRPGRAGVVPIVLAGFAGLILLAAGLDALVVPALTTLSYSAGLAAAAFLRTAADISIWFAVLSLVPVPPLAGGLLVRAAGIRVPARADWILAAAVLAVVATGVLHQLLGPVHAALASVILGK